MPPLVWVTNVFNQGTKSSPKMENVTVQVINTVNPRLKMVFKDRYEKSQVQKFRPCKL